MRRFAVLIALLLMAPCMAFGQTKPASAQNVVQEITALENAWNTAAQKYDISWFERNIADSFISTDEDGVVKDKPAMIEAVKSKSAKLESLAFEKLKVQHYGDTAIVTGIFVIKGTSKGKDISGKYPFTDTWIKLGGRWQCVADHNSRLASK